MGLRLTEVRMGSIVLLNMFTGTLERAVLETLAYSDIFEYPLRLKELHSYLPVRAKMEDLSDVLESLGKRVGENNGFYFLAGRYRIIDVRMQRETRSKKLLPISMKYGRVLGSLPFIRMVALTGSLAVMNVSETADFDYMLVTQAGRLWTARAFAVTFGRMMRPSGHTICVNVLVSENALPWHRHDLYSAREMCHMIPITGVETYHRLRTANAWTESMLPNCGLSAPSLAQISAHRESNQIQRVLEAPLRGAPGQHIERWAMNFQLRRIERRPSAGDETNFSAEVCQANFHHHRKSVWEAFQQRLDHLDANSPISFALKGVSAKSEVAVGEALKVRPR